MASGIGAIHASRRKVLVSAGAYGAGVAAVAVGLACGRDDDDGGSGAGGSRTFSLAERKDTSGKAVRGGTMGSYRTRDIINMDILASTTGDIAASIYSRLFKFKLGVVKPATGEIEGDIVESWELAGDNSALTLKLREALTDPRPPLNGRLINSEDVKFSFTKFLALSSFSANLFNSKSSSSPVLDVQTPDTKTVVLKLAFPYAPLLPSLSDALGFWVQPVEADGKFDPRAEGYGTGPWMLQKYERSVGLEWVRNPNYYLKGLPYLDGISEPIIPEYAAQLAQFRAGRIWAGLFAGGIADRQDDIISTKLDFPELNLFQGELGASSPHIGYGWNGPFRDVRLRQAVSMSIDRQLFADSFTAAKKLSAAGLPTELAINSHLGAGYGPYWVDPTGRGLGDDAKYFKFDLAEAKKLISAAGYPNGLQTDIYSPNPPTYGADWQNKVAALIGMIAESGIKIQNRVVDYSSVFLPTYHFSKGNFDGMQSAAGGSRTDPGQFLQVFYHSEGSATRTPRGQDPTLDALIVRQLQELDTQKRLALIHDIQKHLARNQNATAFDFQNRSYDLVWPWVGNAGVFRPWLSEGAGISTLHIWYDSSKRKS